MSEDHKIREMEARIGNLESQVKFLLRVNGLDLSALRDAPDEELLKYYRDSILLLGMQEHQFAPEIVTVWAELFCQFSEFELVRLQKIVEYDHTWEPFYHLCLKMMTGLRHRKGFSRNEELKNIYALLEKARKNLRDAAVIMIKKYPQSLPQSSKILLKDDPLFALG